MAFVPWRDQGRHGELPMTRMETALFIAAAVLMAGGLMMAGLG
jgi:hypothetical protein